MKTQTTDIVIVGAGPVGLMSAYLAQLSGLSVVIIDKSEGPLQAGRADALNARTLQLLELVGLFDDLYPIGKACNTSSIWEDGKFLTRQSEWWDELEGCFHKHFLMIGQSYLEKLLDEKLSLMNAAVKRSTSIESIELNDAGSITTLSSGEKIKSLFVIGADGAHSFIRKHFEIPFEIIRPQIVWAVIDGIIETDFVKVPEIIVFQAETSDVAWIPREGDIDRFYIRMDTIDFNVEEAIAKINRAMKPFTLRFKKIEWFSHFTVKESVAEKFYVHNRIFLAGDACHVHSVNGGQGLNTGLADAFNLIWKLKMVILTGGAPHLLNSYEQERKPVAQSVIETSGKLVRSTKFSETGTHAQDYIKIVKERSGNITGMGIRYQAQGYSGTRLFDLEIIQGTKKSRLYSSLDYSKYTLLIFGESQITLNSPTFVKIIQIHTKRNETHIWSEGSEYLNQAILVRPDSYIHSIGSINQAQAMINELINELGTK